MITFLKSGTRRLIYLFIGYIALAMLVIMPLLNIYTPRVVNDLLNRELRSELIWFNPFALSLRARGVSLHETSGHQPIAFRDLEVNISVASLWSPGIVLDEFSIDGIDLHVLRESDGTFHFDDLLQQEESNTEDAAPPPGVTIDLLRVQAHTLRFTDRTRPGPYTTVQRDLGLETRGLSTVPDNDGNGVLELIGNGGGTLSWRGELDLAAGNSAGLLTLNNIDLTHAWRYNADQLPFVAESARLAATLNYESDWSGEPEFRLRDSMLRLFDVALLPSDKSVEDTAVELEDLRIEQIDFDLKEQQFFSDSLSISGLQLTGYDKDGDLSLLTLLPPSSEAQDSKDSDSESVDPDSESAWTASLNKLSVAQSQINWRTELLEPAQQNVTPLSFTASALAWPATQSSPFALQLTVNEQLNVALDGELQIGTGDGRVRIDVASFSLPSLNPIVREQLRTDIVDGLLNAKAQLSLADFAPIAAGAEFTIESLATVLHTTGQEAFRFDELAVSGVEVDISEQLLAIETVALTQPDGSIHILDNGEININGVVREIPQATATESQQVEDQGEAESGDAWRIRLSNLQLRDGKLDFADDSLPLPFKAAIEGINADINDFDTAATEPMQLELRGSIDGYAPVVITGGGIPSADNPNMQMGFDFRGIDIATMSPYSGTYAGYAISSGTLNLNLRYALSGQQLDGDNRIVISQMELGEPIESDLAIDVPLKLGLALLTDSQGVIDLSVPISGDVNDPDFSLGPIIGRAITNLIVKAVTAPFTLLASLVGSEEDIERIVFVAGSPDLDQTAISSLAVLADALSQRPQLLLSIEGSVDEVADARELKHQALHAELMAEGLSAESIAAADEAYREKIAARFSELPVSNADAAGSIESIDTTVVEGTSDDSVISLDQQLDGILKVMPLGPGALTDLASERAAAAKRHLVTVGGIDAARVTITYQASGDSAGATMTVDS